MSESKPVSERLTPVKATRPLTLAEAHEYLMQLRRTLAKRRSRVRATVPRAIGLASVAAFLCLGAPARAALPVYTTTVGPALQYDLSATGGKWAVASINNGAATGVSFAFNFLPNSTGTIRWLSIWGETLLGGAANATAPATAGGTFNWLLGAGVGTWNDLISVGLGVPFVSASASSLSGLLTGHFTGGDLHVLIGFHLAIELGAGGLSIAPEQTRAVSDAPCAQRIGCLQL
jgi:hypothetical protein